jgi:hypothetical protein
MLMAWIRTGDWVDLDLEWKQIRFDRALWAPFSRLLLALTPVITFLAWKFSHYGRAFDFVEQNFFGSTFMDISGAVADWTQAVQSLSMDILQRGANYSLIIFLFVLALVACVKCLKEYPEVAWLSIAIILISWGSGPASGMHRYILTAPAVFVALAHWGKHPVFDRAWTLISLLWMGLLAALFAMNMWVA